MPAAGTGRWLNVRVGLALVLGLLALRAEGASTPEEWKHLLAGLTSLQQQATLTWSAAGGQTTRETITTRRQASRWYFDRRSDSQTYSAAFDGARTRVLQAHAGSGLSAGSLVAGCVENPRETSAAQALMPFDVSYTLLGCRLDEFAFGQESAAGTSRPRVGWSQIYTLYPLAGPAPAGLLRIEARPCDPDRFDRYVLDIDPQRGHAVVASRRYSPAGQLLAEMTAKGHTGEIGGLWLPATIGATWFKPDSESRPPAIHLSARLQRGPVQVNASFSEDAFRVEFPEACRVYDHLTGATGRSPGSQAMLDDILGIIEANRQRERAGTQGAVLAPASASASPGAQQPTPRRSAPAPAGSRTAGRGSRVGLLTLYVLLATVVACGAIEAWWLIRRRGFSVRSDPR